MGTKRVVRRRAWGFLLLLLVACLAAGVSLLASTPAQAQTCETDGYEPNNSTDTPTAIGFGGEEIKFGQTALAEICDPVIVDDDRFSFSMNAGDTVTVLVEFEHADGDLRATLFGPPGSGSSVSSDTSNTTTDQELIVHMATHSGVHQLAIDGAASFHENFYLLTVTLDKCNGTDACANIDPAVVGVGSCNGERACTDASGAVGADSCNGFQACDGVAGPVGTGSCTGDLACDSAQANVGDNSCNGASACLSLVAPVGDCEMNLSVVDACVPVFCNGELVTINMNTNGGDGLGTSDVDVILGTPGADVISALGGDDFVCAGGGIDTVRGGAGADWIDGGDGGDTIRGGGGADTIDGGLGADVIDGQGGADTIYGGAGGDTIAGRGAADMIFGGGGGDTIDGQNGGDIIDGGGGNDVIKGQTGPDQLTGGEGDDDLFGGEGADTLFGGPATDKCAGNLGPDSAEAATCETTPGVETLF